MKRWLVVSLLTVVAPGFILAQDTAYKALKTVGTQRGEKALNQVVSVVGESGHAQPVSWDVSLSDSAASAGVRELQITSGVISSERTPVRTGGANVVPIDLSKLNVDSDGAFRLAEQEASQNRVAFDSVNYRLSSNGASGQPVWTLDLIDSAKRPVGTVRIAADTGSLISGSDWASENGNSVPQQRSGQSSNTPAGGFVPQQAPSGNYNRPISDYRDQGYRDALIDNSSDHSGETIGARVNRYGATVVHFGKKVADKVTDKTVRAARKVGGWFQKRFTGRNTLDNDQQQSSNDNRSVSPPSSDPYSQPVRPTQPD